MRRMKRVPPPPVLQRSSSKGAIELEKATAFFAIKANWNKKFVFNAYSDETVRDALRSIFDIKCAYCEGPYAAVMTTDIEHFRPKGAYVERGKPKKPGYWWLAMEWENLLPSCADCNRARAQRIVGKERKEVAGKANQFPLAPGSHRATKPGEERKEKPLLIDPTVEDPSPHLEFLDSGVVRPALVGGVESPRGRALIDVMALQRKDLVDARFTAANATKTAIQAVQDDLDDLQDLEKNPPSSAKDAREKWARLKARLARDTADMEAKAAPTAPYSAVAETLINAFKDNTGL